MDDISRMFCSIFFSAIGLGYFVYGRRKHLAIPLLCGLVLMLCPYLVANWMLLLGLGIVMTALPIVVR